MPSDLQITNIKDQANANSAITIGSDGQITVNQNNPTITLGSNATGFTGIKNADQWRLTTNHTGAQGDLTSNFEQTDDLDSGQIGSAMTQASGIFTFPDTGKWLIHVIGQWFSSNGGITYAGIHIRCTHNAGSGDTYDTKTINYANMDSTSYYQSESSCFLFDVTDVTTHKVKFYAEKSVGDATLQGGTDVNLTTFTFLRLGDT